MRRLKGERRNPNQYADWIDSDAIDLSSSFEVENHAGYATLSVILEGNIEEPQSINRMESESTVKKQKKKKKRSKKKKHKH